MAVVVVIIVGIGRKILAIADFIVAANAIAFPSSTVWDSEPDWTLACAPLAVNGDVAGIVYGNAAEIRQSADLA